MPNQECLFPLSEQVICHMASRSVFPKVDLVVERQWHVGMHARALEGWTDYRVLGGFPSRRYVGLGISRDRLLCRPWPALYNWIRDRFGARLLPSCSEPKSLAAWVKKRPDLAPFVVCYATAYRWLFPALAQEPKFLVVERGSSHPEEMAEKVGRGFREAGIPAPASLAGFSQEVQAGLLAHFVVAGSQMIFDSYASRSTPPERILKIPYGIDVENFPQIQRSGRIQPVRLVLVGILGVRKGLGRLARIGDWAWRRGIPVEFHLVGPLEPEAPELLKGSRASWVFHGVKKGPDLVKVLHHCDVSILPSYEEGFGISVLEGMSTGLPAVVSAETGAKEAIRDGDDGIILENFSDQELDIRLRPLLENPEKRLSMGRAAGEKIRENYTFRHYRDRLREEYGRMFEIVSLQGPKLPCLGERAVR